MAYTLPVQYRWLYKEPGPKMILEVLKISGIKEYAGESDNPVIIGWASEVGLRGVYKHDAIAWCGLAMAVVAFRAGKPVPSGPLWALNWAKFGIQVTGGPMLGDVCTFTREGGGHVGLYVGEDSRAYHIFGGNQSDMIMIARVAKQRLHSVRRPVYINQPANVRKIILLSDGALSVNER